MNTIVAVNSDWGIGFNGGQTIVIPEDRRYFRRVTDGGTIIAGRKTYEDFGRPLPNRKNIVLTRDKSFKVPGIITAHTIEEAIAHISGDDPGKVFVIGGGSVYEAFLPFCTRAYVTIIEASPPSDTFFPNLDDLSGWTLEQQESGIQNTEYGINVGNEQRSPHNDGIYGFIGVIKYSFCIYKNSAVSPLPQTTT